VDISLAMAKKKFDLSKFMVYFIAFVLISSVFGIIFSGYNQTSTTLTYNGHKFTRENNFWSARIEGTKIMFDYFPDQVNDINLSSEAVDMLKNSAQVDFTYDTEDELKEIIALVQFSLEQLLDEYFDIYLRKGFTTENEFGFPIIECSDEGSSVPALYFKSSNVTKISLKGSCIVAEAKNDFDFIRIKDRILYSLLGIIE